MITLIIALSAIAIFSLSNIVIIVYITHWIDHMVSNNKPLFTWAQCQWNQNSVDEVKQSIGFTAPPELNESVDDTQDQDKLTDKQKREQILTDVSATVTSLLRGEVDFDELGE